MGKWGIKWALLSLLFTVTVHAQKKPAGLGRLDSITKGMTADSGLFTVYLQADQNKLFWAIPDSLFGTPLLLVSRYVQLPADYAAYKNAGSKTAEQVVVFHKKGTKVLLQQQSYINQADPESPIAQSVEKNNFAPILAVFDQKNKENDRVLIEMTDFFMDDSPGMNIVSSSEKEQYKMGGVDKKRSLIDRSVAYPLNIETTHTLTFNANKPPRSNRGNTLSIQVNHSLIALPKQPMTERSVDSRVGWFSLEKYNYSSEALKSDNYRIARRWRMEPSDPEAYARGELVTPKKPIVFYLDPATPERWRPYFKQGIEDWAPVFERAGFKNAIVAKDPPSADQDPEFSPEDVRYSTVRYVASTTRNATGPSVADPRSGEILESDVIWYHNHLRSYRNRYLIETAAANPSARSLDTPEEEIGEMMRRVIAHEVGHALGLPHNMKASSAYPVDSLRSADFTQKMGIAATIMAYARYNYVAQPGDEGVRFVRQMGPYDDYAIEWGYRYFSDEHQGAKWLKSFVDERSMNPLYQFGSGGLDPNAQTENIGDDPVKASRYALKNLKIVAKNLESWTTPVGADYEDLKELHTELIDAYRRYINHVIALVGGVNETFAHKGQEAMPYQVVAKDKQFEALSFLHESLWSTPSWLVAPEVVGRFTDEGMLSRVEQLQKAALFRLMSTERLNQMVSAQQTLPGDGLSALELIDTLNDQLVAENSLSDVSLRHLQAGFMERLVEMMEDQKLVPSLRAQAFEQLEDMTDTLRKKKRGASGAVEEHLEWMIHQLKPYRD